MRRGSDPGNTQSEISLHRQSSIDFWCYLEMALSEPRRLSLRIVSKALYEPNASVGMLCSFVAKELELNGPGWSAVRSCGYTDLVTSCRGGGCANWTMIQVS